MNPLENHLVIRNIYKFLDLTTLTSARLVNKLWNECSIRFLENLACIKLTPIKFKIKNSTENIFENFDKVLSQSLRPLSFRNFIVDSLNFENEDGKIFDFIASSLKNAQDITFSNCSFGNKKILVKILDSLRNVEIISFGASCIKKFSTKEDSYLIHLEDALVEIKLVENVENISRFSLPKVKILEITVGKNTVQFCSWNEIFEIFPNISTLSAQCRNNDQLHELTTALVGLKNCKINEFSSFLTEFRDEEVKALAQLNTLFKSLDINISNKVKESSLQLLLSHSKISLKTLKLFHNFSYSELSNRITNKFPFNVHLNNLSELELVGDMIESFDFLQFIPNLKKLGILQDHDEDEPQRSLLVQNMKKSIKHNNMVYFSAEYSFSSKCLKKLGENIFVSLKNISAYLNKESIKEVLKSFKEINKINVLGEVSKGDLSGISGHDLLKITTESDELLYF